jgi:hypothetical protein
MGMTHYSTPNLSRFFRCTISILTLPTLLKSARLEMTPNQGNNSINTLALLTDVVREKYLSRGCLVLEDPEIAARIAKLSVDKHNRRREERQFKAIANFQDVCMRTAGTCSTCPWALVFRKCPLALSIGRWLSFPEHDSALREEIHRLAGKALLEQPGRWSRSGWEFSLEIPPRTREPPMVLFA